ncbi:hypothetical protein Tco_0393183 [Tanacetum coccineum]
MWSPVPVIYDKYALWHLDWITVRRNDDKLYTFKEGDYKRLRLQDIEDMLLLLVQECYKKHCHLKACGRSSVRCRKLPKEAEAYKARHNKDKKNKLMRIDELHKFSDGTLNDVRTALDDILKKIRMKYLPQTHMYSNPMIQPEPEGSTQGYPLDSVEVLRFGTSVGNPIKEILPKLNLPDHKSILTDSKEFIKMDIERRSVKVKELQERCIIKAFQDHQIKKGMNMSVQKSQVYKFTRWQSLQDGEKRLCLVDDLKVFKITFKTS